MRLSSLAGRLADVLQDGGWHSKARPEQLPPPGDWNGWLLMAGRGFGKTRTGLAR
jgi:phage terminase large subunit-like protein